MLNLQLLLFFFLYITYKGYFFLNAKDIICDYSKPESPNCGNGSLRADAGDTVTFKCKYTEEASTTLNNQTDYKNKTYCFEYTKTAQNNFVKLETELFGFYGLKTSKKDGVTTSTVVLPPYISKVTNIACNCHYKIGSDFHTTALSLDINKTSGTAPKLTGCDWQNMDAKDEYTSLTKIKDTNTHICNVYNVTSSSYLAAICPPGYTLTPPQCFKKVNIYKKKISPFNETTKDDEYETVEISKIFKNKKLKSSMGDSSLQYGQLPEGVTEKGPFFCICKKQSSPDKKMNFFLNLNEAEAQNFHEKGHIDVGKVKKDPDDSSGDTNRGSLSYIASLSLLSFFFISSTYFF